MKKFEIVLAIGILLNAAAMVLRPAAVKAQSASQVAYMIQVVGDHTSCGFVSGSNNWCWASDGAWRQLAGENAPSRTDVQTAAAGVTSFKQRTGPVVPQAGDYSFSMVSGQLTAAQMPSSMTCTVSLSTGTGTQNTAVLSGCK